MSIILEHLGILVMAISVQAPCLWSINGEIV